MARGHRKSNAAALSIASNSLLILLKVVIGISIGSVSVISEAIHSSIDLMAAVIAFFSVRISDRPPDEGHPYGHGKIENISGTVEALLILVAAVLIVYEAGNKILSGGRIEFVGLGIGVMLVSSLVNMLVSRYLMHVAKETDSVALEADACHLSTDVLTSAGVLVGLTLVQLTGWNILDPIFAIGVAIVIGKVAFDLTRKSSPDLLDSKLPEAEEQQIRQILHDHLAQCVGFHGLRSRKAGSHRHVDLHLVVDDNVSVNEAHELCDHLEEEILSHLPNTDITIHVEPASTKDTDRQEGEILNRLPNTSVTIRVEPASTEDTDRAS
ncbi:MAG: cation diffusion facilitator family transporter [Chloroflexi bacterium]|nr:cation diffusion facilitator family transporter [Chloroflexota bacterium]